MKNISNDKKLLARTKVFALRIIRMVTALPQTKVAQILGNQVLRSGTSVGAHYREACRSRSAAEFISKMQGGLQELEETSYWLELIAESELVSARRLISLREEAEELKAMFAASVITAKKRK